MSARKNKVLSKSKAKMVEPNNERDKAYDEASPSPDEASPGPAEAGLNSDMGRDLEPESWAENEEGESSDQDEILEGIDYTKEF